MTTENTQTEATPHKITIDDIALIVNIISAVSRRGAFEAAEFTVVGGLFEKLKGFLPEPEVAQTNTVETTNSSEVTPSNQLNFDFSKGLETTTNA